MNVACGSLDVRNVEKFCVPRCDHKNRVPGPEGNSRRTPQATLGATRDSFRKWYPARVSNTRRLRRQCRAQVKGRDPRRWLVRLSNGACLEPQRGFGNHPKYLNDVEIPANTHATTDEKEALQEASFLVHCVPVQHSRRYLRKISKLVPNGVPVLCTSKGIDRKTLNLMCEILPSQLGEGRSYAFLSGPSFAREIAEGLATAVVVASEDRRVAFDFRDLLASESFRVFTSADVVGLEVGGAVKNVLALAAGMCEGLDLGTNAVTALVTRGLYEMQRIALAMGGRASTIAGLSGVGDTFGTCFGPLSRNRNTGVRLGRGERLDDILMDMGEVAEGVETAFALERLIKKSHKSYRLDLKFPIIFGVAEILRGDRTPREGLEALMGLPLRPEFIASVSDGPIRRRPLSVSAESDDDRDIDFAD